MAVSLSPIGGAGWQFFTSTGSVLTGGKLYTYAAGTTTPQATYTTNSGATAHANPIILDSAGRVPSGGEIWITVGTSYKFVLKDNSDVLIGTYDNILGGFDSSNVVYQPAGTGAVTTTVQTKLREIVSVLDFGADPTGANSSTTAVQNATNTGKAVYFPAGTYKVSGVTYTGTVVWSGEGVLSKILSDSVVLTVTNGDNSQIDNLYMENITAPWIITRNPSSWATVPTVYQSNNPGYQPTVNDNDIWSSLTSAQQNQDIGPQIVFTSSSTTSTNVTVSRITGRFVSIILYNCINSVVRDCDFRAGKNFAAGILFWNMTSGVSAGYMNRAINNVVRYPSYCGITFARNYDGLIEGNQVEYAGESGIKTFQDTVGGVQAYCYRMQILGNFTKYSYYDGFDLQAQQALVGVIDTRHNVADNSTFGNYRTGYIMDGRNCLFANNYSRSSGLTGMKLVIPYSLIQGNTVYEGNELNVASGEHQILIGGDYISITGNFTSQSVANGVGIYAEGQNFVSGNKTIGSGAYLGAAGSIVARTFGNQFGTSVDVTTNTMSAQTRQNLTGTPASVLYSDTSSFDNIDQTYFPRKHLLANPIAKTSGILSNGTSGAEYGYLEGYAASNGSMVNGWRILTDTSQSGKAWLMASAPTTAVSSGNQSNGTVTFYLDESGSNIKFQVKYSGGTVKTGTLAVV